MDKLSLTVDMRDEKALARLRTLIAEMAQVVLQNLRPGAVERFGLDAETLRQDNPGLVYCNVGAFGAGGPLNQLPGYDPLMQAFSGITDLTGEADRPPSRVGVSLIDLNADSRAIYEALGPDVAPTAFNDGGRDKTHHNNYGAFLLASAVAQRIRTILPDLAPHVTAPAFDPRHPPSAEQIAIVPSLIHSDQRPAGN